MVRIAKRILPARLRRIGSRAWKRIEGGFHRALYAGDRVECPCCGGRYEAFRPFGVRKRPNAQCPGCGALERHRQIWLYLRDHTNLLQRPARLLHVAPEPSLRKALSGAAGIDYVCGDLEPGRGDLQLDVTRLPFDDGWFDVILCNHVLEHVQDDRRAMAELFRVLRAGGWAILQTPLNRKKQETFEDPSVTGPEERLRLYGQHDHVRIYGLDLYGRLQDAGFVLDLDYFARELPADVVERHGLVANEPIMRCCKPAAPVEPTGSRG